MGGAAHRPDPKGFLTGMDEKIRKRIKGSNKSEDEDDENTASDDGDDDDESDAGSEDEDEEDEEDSAHESEDEQTEDGTAVDKHGARPEEVCVKGNRSRRKVCADTQLCKTEDGDFVVRGLWANHCTSVSWSREIPMHACNMHTYT
jgi:hypothetical protein